MKARHSQWMCVMAIGLACGPFSACGDDDTTVPTDAGSDAGGGHSGGGGKSGSGGAGKSGSGGAGKSGSGGAGKSGSGGAGSGDHGGTGGAGSGGHSGAGAGGHGGSGGNVAPVVCGSNTCTVNAVLKMINPNATACCVDDACGQNNVAGDCLLKNAPGPDDESCPPITIPITIGGQTANQTLAGCCAPGNQCGLNFSGVGWGCVARSDVAADMGGPLSSQACGAGLDGGLEDAGL
jgi:hypothetical protein